VRNCAPPSIAGVDNLSERNGFSGELSGNRAAQEAFVAKHPNFAHVARIDAWCFVFGTEGGRSNHRILSQSAVPITTNS
jgi:hypothetical protein